MRFQKIYCFLMSALFLAIRATSDGSWTWASTAPETKIGESSTKEGYGDLSSSTNDSSTKSSSAGKKDCILLNKY